MRGSNTICGLTAILTSEVCCDVAIEPDLHPVCGESLSYATSNSDDGAFLDIAVSGFGVAGSKELIPCSF